MIIGGFCVLDGQNNAIFEETTHLLTSKFKTQQKKLSGCAEEKKSKMS